MARRIRFWRVLLVVGVLVVAGQVVFVSWPVSSQASSCDALRQWAQRYADTRPSLEEFAIFSRGERIAIFNAIGPEARAALWRDQLRQFSQRPDLSQRQRAIVLEAIALTTPAAYAEDAQAGRRLSDFSSSAVSAFSTSSHRRVWFDLGVVVETSAAAAPSIWTQVTHAFRPAAQSPSCDCNKQFAQEDCPGGQCIDADCSWTDWGCGTAWAWPCKGMCTS